jgi:hypothetical protein
VYFKLHRGGVGRQVQHRIHRCYDLTLPGTLKARWIVVLVLGLAIAAMQIASGAYSAEFDAHPDESGQFVSGLMVYDYLTQLPSGNPLAWATRYYLHYPRIAIGRWPPGFAMSEAIGWLAWPPSRWSAIALVGAFVWAAAVVFHRLASRMASPVIASAASLLLVAAPAVAFSYSAVMADAPCLLASVLILDTTVGLMERFRPALLWRCAAILLLALSMKGTALCLAPVPFAALLAAHEDRRKHLRRTGIAVLLAAIACAAICLARPDVFQALRALAGANLGLPWRGDLALRLVGYGFDLLAAIGVWFAVAHRRPAAVAAASMLVSILIVSFGLRAMQEPRHWVILIPPILLLGIEAISQLATTRMRLAVLCLAALAFFPFQLSRQHPAGYSAMAAKIRLPSRMLISSATIGEGPWIAAVALREKRPASVVIRATKVLASMGWNGENYRLLVDSPRDVLTRLDELGIDVIVVHSPAGARVPPHQVLLLNALSGSDAWRAIDTGVPSFQEWSRVKPPAVQRKPLEIGLSSAFVPTIHE